MYIPGQRQAEVLNLLARGYANKQIASRLGLSEATIEYHIHQLFVRTGYASRVELALWELNGRREIRPDLAETAGLA